MIGILTVHRPLEAEYFLERMIFTWQIDGYVPITSPMYTC